MFRKLIFSLFLCCTLSQSVSFAQCYVNLGDVTGYDIPQAELNLINTVACDLQTVMPTAYQPQFKVFSGSFYVEEEFYAEYPYSKAFLDLKQTAAQQSPYYVVIGWQSDTKGLNTHVFVEVKLPQDSAFCFPGLDSLVKGVLIDEINENFSGTSGTGLAKVASEFWGLKGLGEYLQKMKACCAAGGNPNECLHCGASGNNKAILNAMGFKKIQIHGVGAHPEPFSSPDVINKANLLFTIEDLVVVDLGDKYSEVIDAYHAQGFTIKVIVTKDSTLCTPEWDELKTLANSNEYDVVYWSHIHQGNGLEDQWLYTQVFFHGGGNTPDSLANRPSPDSLHNKLVATNVIAGLASAATDFLFQVLAHYIFDDDIETGQWGKAVGRVDAWEVAKSGIFGLFGVNSKIEAIVNSLAYATTQTISIAKYYEQHPPQPPNPSSYNFNWAAKDFGNLFMNKLIEEGAVLLLGGAAGKAIGKAKEIPFSGWCKIARMLNRNLGTMIPGCFAAGTIVLTAQGPVPIQQIRPGDWALTDPHLSPHQFVEINTKTFGRTETKPELWTEIDGTGAYLEKTAPQQDVVLNIPILPEYDFEEITPETWGIVNLTLLKTDGSRCEISLLRPFVWMEEQGLCAVGDSTWLNLPDMRVSGIAQAKSFAVNCLDTRTAESKAFLERGYYPVLAAFRHKADEVLHLRFTNGDRLTVTAPHPFWSLDRDGWLAAEKLNYGERVKTVAGEAVIDTMEIAFEEMPVYNLEVWKVHGYCVGRNGEVVHNGCGLDLKEFIGYTINQQRDRIKDIWKFGYPEFFERGKFLEKLIQSKKLAGYFHSGEIMHNFEALDSFKPKKAWTFIDNGVAEVVQCSEAISIKSTKAQNLDQWKATYKSHLDKLRDNMGLNNNGFTGKGKKVVYEKAKVIIVVPEENLTMVLTWRISLKTLYPTLDFEVLTAEKLL
jgi:hypothetical protein